jgi:hypothetical protein
MFAIFECKLFATEYYSQILSSAWFLLKGREYDMFSKLAKKYRTQNPLQVASDQNFDASHQPRTSTAMTDESAPLSESSIDERQSESSIPTIAQDGSMFSVGSVSSPFPSETSHKLGLSIMSPSVPHMSSPSLFGLASNVPSQSHQSSGMSNENQIFRGKSARELLTAFYQEKNPSKISDVDSLLMKYQVRSSIDACFVNLLGTCMVIPKHLIYVRTGS